MKKNLGAWAASSADSTEVSNRVKGIVLALSSIIIYLAANLFGLELSATDVIDLGSMLGFIAGALWSVYGAGLALVRLIAEKRY